MGDQEYCSHRDQHSHGDANGERADGACRLAQAVADAAPKLGKKVEKGSLLDEARKGV